MKVKSSAPKVKSAKARIAINGFGRIGRNFLRVWIENKQRCNFEVVAINDIGSIESLAHLVKYDTTHGTFSRDVVITSQKGQQGIQIEKVFIPFFQFPQPQLCPWKENNIHLVLESSGKYRARADAQQHIDAGAKQVVIAAVAFDEVDATIIVGVNDKQLTKTQRIISAASCTSHCLAPVLQLLDKKIGVEQVMMTEMHAYTSDQQLLDHAHRDLRRARAGAQNLIPTTSSSISAVQKVLPQFDGKIAGYSMRVPVNNVAAVDLTVSLKKALSREAINSLFEKYPDKKIIAYSNLPLVSSDFNHRYESAIFDATQTLVLGKTIKILVWYDNEWGYVNRLLDLLCAINKR